jgi:myo-inositol-1(or 4)-monophosphatase
VQQAVVYDPTRNDLFYASRGKGAFLNDRRIRVSKRTRMLESLIGTGFPFRKGDNFQRYMKMFEEVMVQCAGVRRPGAASLDLCYVAAGYYDAFFETGLSPWDIAAGSLIITEAGGLVGNFTGESDFLYQREIVAGTPRIYGQMVKILAPYSRVITDAPAGADGERAPSDNDDEQNAEDDALIAMLQSEEDSQRDDAPAAEVSETPKEPVRRRITASAKAQEDAERARLEPQPRGRRPGRGEDSPF